MDKTILFALLLSFLAGSATMLGGMLAFLVKRDNLKVFAIGLGLSAGVMLYVSFMELMPDAIEALSSIYPENKAKWIATILFFSGIAVACLVDRLIPAHIEKGEVTHEPHEHKHHLTRMGMFTAIALAIHNFPEGLATFMGAMDSKSLGISIAVAVGLHNIPEGVAVALPIYNATGDKKKAFLYSALSGMAEPVGAIAGFLFLRHFMGPAVFGMLFAAVAGIMVYISLDELLPTATEYGDGHAEIYGAIAGMFIMAVSMLIF
ncbi:zinc transporter [Parelusimicrobium proximum]|uniref:zinc transporter ZupT n=1 Tax=Parelusimicrobium proximum TaxID=3228953 RepID=UPI003D163861